MQKEFEIVDIIDPTDTLEKLLLTGPNQTIRDLMTLMYYTGIQAGIRREKPKLYSFEINNIKRVCDKYNIAHKEI